MDLHRALFALLGLLAGTNARSLLESRTINGGATPIPTATLITDFQKDGVNASWAQGHPQAWGSEKIKYEGGLVVDVSPDESFLALASNTGNLTIRDSDTLEIISSVDLEHQGYLGQVIVFPDGDEYNVFVGFENYTTYNSVVQTRLSSTGAVIGKQTEYRGLFSRYNGRRGPFSPDGRRFVLVSKSDAIVYDIDNPTSPITLSEHTAQVISASFSPDGTLIATAGWDGYGRIWNATTGELLENLGPSGAQNWFANWSPDGEYVLVTNGMPNAALKIWTVSDFSAEPVVVQGFPDWIRTGTWSSDANLLAAGSYGFLQVYSMEENKVVQSWLSDDRTRFETGDVHWIEGKGAGLKLTYRTDQGLEVYDFETNLKYRWGPEQQRDGYGSGFGTVLLKKKGLIGGSEIDGSVRFFELPL